LQQGLVHSKINCAQLPVLKGQNGVFFGEITQSDSGVVAVQLQPCDANGVYSDCEMDNIRSQSFGTGCGTPSGPPQNCICVDGSSYNQGAFGCEGCTCVPEPASYDGEQCPNHCQVSASCILVPSMIACGVLMVILVCTMVIIRRRRMAQETETVELSDMNPAVTNNYAYQPVMTSPPPNSVVMTTPQGNTVMTQPMYMMTQTGEPVVVQVAYM